MLKIALLQMATQWQDKQGNCERARELIHCVDADLVVLPEMFTTGFTMNATLMAETMEGATVEWLLATSRESGKAIIGSIIIKQADPQGVERFYNRLMFVTPQGELSWYDKRHLFRMSDENTTYTPGTERLVVTYKGFRIMPVVCYDLRFPVWLRNRGDYDLLVNIACWGAPRAYAWSTLLRARAIENICYVAGVNMVGSDPNGDYCGNSAVIDFLGQPLVESTQPHPEVLCATLEMAKLTAFRTRFPAALDADEFEILP